MKLLIIALVFFTSIANAADKKAQIDMVYSKLISSLPVEGQLMMSPYVESLDAYGSIVEADFDENSEAIGGKAIRVKVNKKGKNPWDAGVTSHIAGEFKKGDVLYMMFWARASELPIDKQSTVLKGVGIQQAVEPYASFIARDFQLTGEWQTIALAGVAPKDFASNDAQVTFQVAADKHTVEFGPVFVINLGSKDRVDMSALPFLTQ